MGEGEIKINTGNLKEGLNKTFGFFRQKRTANITIALIFLTILVFGVFIRVQNFPLLKGIDGQYIAIDPDAIYFQRIAETIIENGGLPETDIMRQPGSFPFTREILPHAIVLIYKFLRIFDSGASIQFAGVISPVVFFALSMIVFFFLCYALTNSRLTAILSSLFLVVHPAYLYRTIAGVEDHEPIGMFAFFLTLLAYTIALKVLDREEVGKSNLYKIIGLSLCVGFFSSFTIASWGGIANFIFLIVPLSFGVFWLIKTKDFEEAENRRKIFNYFVFYAVWFFSSILFTFIYGFPLQEILGRVVISSTSLANAAVFLFLIVDFANIRFGKRFFAKSGKEERFKRYRVLYTLGILVVLGIFFLFTSRGAAFGAEFVNRLLNPFGTDRVSLTVAENQQPYLDSWISQMGKVFFWLFLGGITALGIKISLAMASRKRKIFFAFFWILMIFGILFSRFSPTSLFNGANLISKLFYFGSVVLFAIYFLYVYFKEKIDIKPEFLIISAWMIFMLISTKGAVRLFFVITPFVCFMVAFFIHNVFVLMRKTKDDLFKVLIGTFLAVILIFSILSVNALAKQTLQQAEFAGPGTGYQWQNAMKWTRENTPEGSIFVHWWDYGYWIQYFGKRPTISDGGHFEGAFRDHLVGRYLLTTPHQETALSFFKTYNISYLLIDPTDIGKYSAFSTIGSDSIGSDRFSYLPAMILDPSQTQETNISEIRVYQGAANTDQDITFNKDGSEIFLPRQRTIIAGFFIEMVKSEDSISFKQPEAVFIYNSQQFRVPVRYIYSNSRILDFGNGLDAGFFMVPLATQTGENLQMSEQGAAIYLSPKVFSSLFAQMYLMNDPFGKYSTIRLAHSESDPFIGSLRTQVPGLNEFVFFNGIRGPIKIWDTRVIPDNILVKEELLRGFGEYAEFDNLTFTR